MPRLNDFEATHQILLAAPDTKILVLSAHSGDEYVAPLMSARQRPQILLNAGKYQQKLTEPPGSHLSRFT
jgi:DNA-binding NarL/FixJ family response regulator